MAISLGHGQGIALPFASNPIATYRSSVPSGCAGKSAPQSWTKPQESVSHSGMNGRASTVWVEGCASNWLLQAGVLPSQVQKTRNLLRLTSAPERNCKRMASPGRGSSGSSSARSKSPFSRRASSIRPASVDRLNNNSAGSRGGVADAEGETSSALILESPCLRGEAPSSRRIVRRVPERQERFRCRRITKLSVSPIRAIEHAQEGTLPV